MLFGVENAEIIGWVIGGAGLTAIGALGKWGVDIWAKRREWGIADDERTLTAWKEFAKKKEENEEMARKEVILIREDFSARLRSLEASRERELRRRYRCERRLDNTELAIENLQYAVDRFNEQQEKKGGDKVHYRKHVPETADDDDSEFDLNPPPGPVRPHGPEGEK